MSDDQMQIGRSVCLHICYFLHPHQICHAVHCWKCGQRSHHDRAVLPQLPKMD